MQHMCVCLRLRGASPSLRRCGTISLCSTARLHGSSCADISPPRVVLVNEISPAVVQALRSIEEEVFPPCEQLGQGFEQHVALRTNKLFVAEVGGLPAGFLISSQAASVATITKLAVQVEHQNRGIGSALLRFSLDELCSCSRRLPLTGVVLHVDPSRVGAIRLYERSGFTAQQTLHGYYDGDRDVAFIAAWNTSCSDWRAWEMSKLGMR